MKIGFTIAVGQFQSQRFDSSEHPTAAECARELITAMTPLASSYPPVKKKIEELRLVYGITP